jgi:hypothetical protein
MNTLGQEDYLWKNIAQAVRHQLEQSRESEHKQMLELVEVLVHPSEEVGHKQGVLLVVDRKLEQSQSLEERKLEQGRSEGHMLEQDRKLGEGHILEQDRKLGEGHILEQVHTLGEEHIVVDKCRKIGKRVGYNIVAACASSSLSSVWDAISYSNPSNLLVWSILSWLELVFLLCLWLPWKNHQILFPVSDVVEYYNQMNRRGHCKIRMKVLVGREEPE